MKLIDMTGWVMAEHGVPDSRLSVVQAANSRAADGTYNTIEEAKVARDSAEKEYFGEFAYAG